jgi:GAF domain
LGKNVPSASPHVTDLLEASVTELHRQAIGCPPDLSVWTKLYVTQQTLLSAMKENRVSSALVEICSNLLGCEEVAIVKIERGTGEIHFVHQEGLSPEKRRSLVQNTPLLDSRIEPGIASIPSDGREDLAHLLKMGISALVPLWADERSRGAMILFQLLPQHNAFDAEDREILQLLSIYAGPCLRNQSLG